MSGKELFGLTRATDRGHRRSRRALLVIVAAALLVPITTLIGGGGAANGGVITTPPFELVDKGTLTLNTGATNDVVQRDSIANGSGVLSTQSITSSGCTLSTTPTLLAFSTGKGSPGLNSGNIGDKTKGAGTDCGLVEVGGSLTLKLGSSVSDLEISSFAFDIETRKNVNITLTAKVDGSVTSTYKLRSGTSIVTGEGSSTPGDLVFNCNSQSSSNPNSGDRDNCRWSGDVLADELVLAPSIGEFSLAGGVDGGVSQPSVLELTDVDGFLDCESQPNSGDFDLSEGGNGTPEVGIIRKDNLDPNEPCDLIPVDLQTYTSDGLNVVEFLKDLTTQQSAAFTTEIIWPNEGAQDPMPPTQISFVEGELHDLNWCLGTPVYEEPGHVFMGIEELMDGDISEADIAELGGDMAPTLDGFQYICKYYEQTELVGGVEGTTQVHQKDYVVGDIYRAR